MPARPVSLLLEEVLFAWDAPLLLDPDLPEDLVDGGEEPYEDELEESSLELLELLGSDSVLPEPLPEGSDSVLPESLPEDSE